MVGVRMVIVNSVLICLSCVIIFLLLLFSDDVEYFFDSVFNVLFKFNC